MYLLDEQRNSVFYGYDDVAWMSLPQSYFGSCVYNKLSFSSRSNSNNMLLRPFYDKNIPQIKEILLTDPDIWLPQIR
jgi:hypothetical protein